MSDFDDLDKIAEADLLQSGAEALDQMMSTLAALPNVVALPILARLAARLLFLTVDNCIREESTMTVAYYAAVENEMKLEITNTVDAISADAESTPDDVAQLKAVSAVLKDQLGSLFGRLRAREAM